jgi:hypothetical protein
MVIRGSAMLSACEEIAHYGAKNMSILRSRRAISSASRSCSATCQTSGSPGRSVRTAPRTCSTSGVGEQFEDADGEEQQVRASRHEPLGAHALGPAAGVHQGARELQDLDGLIQRREPGDPDRVARAESHFLVAPKVALVRPVLADLHHALRHRPRRRCHRDPDAPGLSLRLAPPARPPCVVPEPPRRPRLAPRRGVRCGRRPCPRPVRRRGS